MSCEGEKILGHRVISLRPKYHSLSLQVKSCQRTVMVQYRPINFPPGQHIKKLFGHKFHLDLKFKTSYKLSWCALGHDNKREAVFLPTSSLCCAAPWHTSMQQLSQTEWRSADKLNVKMVTWIGHDGFCLSLVSVPEIPGVTPVDGIKVD